MQVTILGAGGSMGQRITKTLRDDSRYSLRLVEPGESARRKIEESGLSVVSQEEGLRGADVVVLAVPDRLMGQIAADVVPAMDPGASLLLLDPAAAAVGEIPERPDVQCYVTHPTHPPLYSLLDEPDAAARRDFWGGGLARQAIVFATAWGDDEHADAVERLCLDMFAPTTRSHRITVRQMAMLEPALSETLTNGCIAIIREGMQRVIASGVPAEAVEDFLMGHLQIGISLIFEKLDWTLSDGAQVALQNSRSQLFRDDWDAIFSDDSLDASLHQITHSS